MIEVGKALNSVLSGGLTAMKPHPEYGRNETGDTYIIWRVTGNNPSDTKSGVSTIDEVEVEISIFSTSIETVTDLSKKVRADLDRLSYGVYSGVSLNGVQYQDEDTDYDSTTNRYECEQRYIFRVQRALLK